MYYLCRKNFHKSESRVKSLKSFASIVASTFSSNGQINVKRIYYQKRRLCCTNLDFFKCFIYSRKTCWNSELKILNTWWNIDLDKIVCTLTFYIQVLYQRSSQNGWTNLAWVHLLRVLEACNPRCTEGSPQLKLQLT